MDTVVTLLFSMYILWYTVYKFQVLLEASISPHKIARKKGLTQQEIAAFFEESDNEDENVHELFSKEELAEAQAEEEDPTLALQSAEADGDNLDLDFELDDEEDRIDNSKSKYQNVATLVIHE